jgi:hypothetical protein
MPAIRWLAAGDSHASRCRPFSNNHLSEHPRLWFGLGGLVTLCYRSSLRSGVRSTLSRRLLK